jgi:hypothetical protein
LENVQVCRVGNYVRVLLGRSRELNSDESSGSKVSRTKSTGDFSEITRREFASLERRSSTEEERERERDDDDDDDDDDDEDDDDVATGIRSVSNDSCRRVAAGVARQSVPYH